MKDETLSIHHGYETDPTTKSVATPIYQTVAYEFDSAQHGADLFNLEVPGNIYTRIMNPTNDVLEQRMAALEGGIAGLVVSAGSAAINYAILTLAEAGDNIVSTPQLYGGTYTLFAHMLPKQGIQVKFAKDDSQSRLQSLLMRIPKRFTVNRLVTQRVISSILRVSRHSHIRRVCQLLLIIRLRRRYCVNRLSLVPIS